MANDNLKALDLFKRPWLASTFRPDGHLVIGLRYLEHRLSGALIRKVFGHRPRFFGSVQPSQRIVRR